MPTKVLFINRSYWPDAEATGQLLTDLCESLAGDFDVHVLCGQPNSNPTHATFATSGTEVRGGVTIHRLTHTQFNKRRPWGRIANLVSFTLATKRWLKDATSFDIVVCETDPFLLPLVTAPHCKRSGSKFIAYLQDIYPDIAIRLGKAKDGRFTRSLRRRLRDAYRSAAAVVVLSEGMKQELVGWGLSPESMTVIPNWVDCTKIVPVKSDNAFRKAHGLANHFVVMHSGNMGLSQRLDALVLAVDEADFPARGKIVLVGGGADEPRLRQLASQRRRASDILFLPYQPRESLSDSLSAADLHVVSVDPRIGGTLMPSKLYGILATATPILAIASAGSDVATLIESHQLGCVVSSHEPASISGAISRWSQEAASEIQQAGNRARQLAVEKFDRSICTRMFARLLAGKAGY